MRFLFFGAGAIGLYVGGSLALAGDDVAFLERPEIADQVRRDGLMLDLGRQTRRIPVRDAYGDPAEALRSGPFDLAVAALKSYDTAAAVEPLKEWKSRLPPLLCLQNGVENEAVWETAFGSGGVIAGTVTSAVGRIRVGAVRLERKRGLGVAAGRPSSAQAVAALNRAGLNARLFPSAPAMKWSKMLTNLIANASSAILAMDPRAVYSDPRLFAVEREMLRECLRVMRAGGIGVTDLPGTPVRWLALAVESLPNALARPLLARAVGGGRGGKMPSLYLDLQAGRGKSEVGWLNGAVARAGKRLGAPAPVNALLAETLARIIEGAATREEYQNDPEKLIARLPRETLLRIGLL
jgi:2-dehydropantoate 2-reductase